MKRIGIGVLVVIVLVIGFMVLKKVGFYSEQSTPQASNEKKPLFWMDPMNPMVRYNKPGVSTMGMKLVPVYADSEQKGEVRISPEIVDNLGVRTAPVVKGTLARKIETVGYVMADENLISHIHTYVDGWIQNLVVKTTQAPVTKGELLFQLYSRGLVNAEEEYLIALQSKQQPLIEASYQKLRSLGMAPSQIQQLKKTGKVAHLLDVYSPQKGIVAALNVREGNQVTPEKDIMSIVDLSTIWVIVEVFEQHASWVNVGQPAEATFPAFPGKIWKGCIEFVYPELNLKTRTVKVRLRFANPDNRLQPNMYAMITLPVEPMQNVLSIPKEALIQTEEGIRVVVSLGKGRFRVQPVVPGIESGSRVEILSGLHEGERVVSSGEFLIDSEASIKASLQRLNDEKGN
ncbi:TPA: efflux RND transporter periplasmic adaptor subunit [Legionella anisa]|uniref:efflux RND transporter periplasmic adaptor subunit n=1 Tax=Legionella anisa TaxID=28082 RepID=UPI001981A5D3|nr:efflux RND transporter periplasmic adaptor subunit [Legionella anisa]MBN5937482.1 efflux RND transporter periplasmic adaptor subunit [Legionella anisa]